MAEISLSELGAPDAAVFEQIGDAKVPWRYTTLGAEYEALRHEVAVFDLSGCGLIALDGDGADDLMAGAFTREVEFLSPETSVMGMFLDEDARPLDIITVFRTDTGFLLETSVGRGSATFEYLKARSGDDVEVARVDDAFTLLGFEGPRAWPVVEGLADEPITGLPFQGVRPTTIDGIEVTISRTGFTGEFGFKILVPRADAPAIWSRVVAQATPAGHEVLELAMTEFRQPILHREADAEWATVLRCGLNWLVDVEKEDFIGRDALLAQRDDAPEGIPVCIMTTVEEIAPGAALLASGEVVGHVTHVVHNPELGVRCGVAQLRPDCACAGVVFDLESSPAAVQTVSAPIRIPTSWGELLAQPISEV